MKMLKTKMLTRRVVDMPALYRDIGARLKAARERAGLSQEEVGIAIGMTRANVANLEAGKTRIMLEHIYNVALMLNRPVRELMPQNLSQRHEVSRRRRMKVTQ